MKEDETKPKPDDTGNAGKIAGQMMKKDTATALLFRNSRENFAGLFSRTVFSGTPVLPDDGRGDLRLHRRTADRVWLLQICGGQGRTEKIYRRKPGTFQQCFRNGDGRAGGTDPFPAAAKDPDAGISDTGRRLQRVSGNSRND